MKKIMIIGAGDFQVPLIDYATANFDVVVVAPYISKDIEDKVQAVYNLDVREKEEILRIAQKEKINGVITDQTDIPVRTVAYVAEEMGLPGIGYETGKLFTDKYLMREKMRELSIPLLPSQKVYSVEEAIDFFDKLSCDVIIRPTDTQGSRGVRRCSTRQEIMQYYPCASVWSSDGGVLIEKYASGREFVVEGIALDYKFENLIIGDTLYFGSGNTYAANKRIFPAEADSKLIERVFALNKKIHNGFGIKQGITHSEYIMDGDEIYLIETAARGGGVFISSDLIMLSTGICTEEFLINICLGNQEEMPIFTKGVGCCGYMAFFIPQGEIICAEGIDDVLSLPYVHRNQLHKIHVGLKINGAPADKTSRYAIIVSGKNRCELNRRMQKIKDMIMIKVQHNNEVKSLIWE